MSDSAANTVGQAPVPACLPVRPHRQKKQGCGYWEKHSKARMNKVVVYFMIFNQNCPKKGVIKRKGETLSFLPNHNAIWLFFEGLCLVEVGKKRGFIDKTGEVVIKMKRGHNGRSFHDGLAGVRKNEKWGFINRAGGWVIKPSYRKIGWFKEGVCSVMV